MTKFIVVAIVVNVFLIGTKKSCFAQLPDPAYIGSISNGAFGNAASIDLVTAICVQGNYAYVTSRDTHSLEIIDVSNPANPTFISRVSRDDGYFMTRPQAVTVNGSYAYVVSFGDNALEIFDISNPATPVHSATLMHGDEGAYMLNPYAIAIKGNYAVISARTGYLIADITDPNNPHHVKSWGEGGKGTYSDQVSIIYNDLVYSYDGGGLIIWNLFGEQRVRVGGIGIASELGGGTTMPALAIDGNFAYVSCFGGQGIAVVDISDPSKPEIRTTLEDGETGAILKQCRSLAVKGNYLYVGNTGTPTEIIDISDPSDPRHASNFPFSGTVYQFHVAGEQLYCGSQSAMTIVNIQDPLNTKFEGQISHSTNSANLHSGVMHVSTSGNSVYICSYEGVTIIDVTDPARPTHQGVIPADYPSKCQVVNNIAYVNYDSYLSIIDITNKESPTELSRVDWGGRSTPRYNFNTYLEVRGKFAYWMGHWGTSLDVIDISDPYKPKLYSSFDLGYSRTAQLKLQGNYLYAATDQTLKVFDITSSIRLVATLEIPFPLSWVYYKNIFIDGSYIYATAEHLLYVIDISNPLSPSLVSTSEIYELQKEDNIHILGDYAYLLTSSSVIVFNISNPAAPKKVKEWSTGIGGLTLFNPSVWAGSGPYMFLSAPNLVQIVDLNILVTAASEDIVTHAGLQLYPNPTNNELSIVSPEIKPGLVNLRILNLQGQQMEQKNCLHDELRNIDVSGYPSGIYLLIVEQNGKSHQSLFIME